MIHYGHSHSFFSISMDFPTYQSLYSYLSLAVYRAWLFTLIMCHKLLINLLTRSTHATVISKFQRPKTFTRSSGQLKSPYFSSGFDTVYFPQNTIFFSLLISCPWTSEFGNVLLEHRILCQKSNNKNSRRNFMNIDVYGLYLICPAFCVRVARVIHEYSIMKSIFKT